MKIAVIADPHSNYLVFKKVLDDAEKQKVDTYFFMGDYTTDGYEANKILDIIRKSNGYVINGNREDAIINYHREQNPDWHINLQWANMMYGYSVLSKENLAYLETLNTYQIIELEGKRICLSHCTPYNVTGEDVFFDSYAIFDRLIKDYPADIYVFGHEHKCFSTIYKGKYFLNPGTCGIPSFGLPYTYGLLEIEANHIKFQIIDILYDYQELYNYYINSEYYEQVPEWCELILADMRDGKDHNEIFVAHCKERMQKMGINGNSIPNDIYLEVFKEYKNRYFPDLGVKLHKKIKE